MGGERPPCGALELDPRTRLARSSAEDQAYSWTAIRARNGRLLPPTKGEIGITCILRLYWDFTKILIGFHEDFILKLGLRRSEEVRGPGRSRRSEEVKLPRRSAVRERLCILRPTALPGKVCEANAVSSAFLG